MSGPRAWLGRLWTQTLWPIAGAVSIRTKLLGIVLGPVLLLGLGTTWQVRQILVREMDAQLEEQGSSVARDLAARSADPILINDLYGLHQLLQETQANNANVRYAFLASPDGTILAHTFGPGFPPGLLAANGVEPGGHHHTVMLTTEEGVIWDTAVPIFDGRAGVARIGLAETGVRAAVNAVTGQLLLTTVFVSLLGISAAALLTWVLTRPLLELVQAAQAVGRGAFDYRVTRWANDELGDLADAFNTMTGALARAAEERAERDSLRARYVQGAIAAQEDERKRLARELHDSTSQSLTSLLVGLRTLADTPDVLSARAQADELRAIAARTLDEVHDLALELRPSVLDDLGLPAALARYVAEYQRRYPLHLDLAIAGLERERLPAEVETALYRIVQEALTNVARHAQAGTASVLIERHNGSVRAIVEDDGRGFDPQALATRERRLGLYGIEERATLLGGTLTVESAPGHGASLFVEIPLAGKPPKGPGHA